MSNRDRGRGRMASQARVMEDPRVDGILMALREVGILIGRQTRDRDAIVVTVAEVVVVAVNGVNRNNGNNRGLS